MYDNSLVALNQYHYSDTSEIIDNSIQSILKELIEGRIERSETKLLKS